MTEAEKKLKELKEQVEILKNEVIEYIFHCNKLENALRNQKEAETLWWNQYNVKDKRLKKALKIMESTGIHIQDEASLDKGNEDAF